MFAVALVQFEYFRFCITFSIFFIYIILMLTFVQQFCKNCDIIANIWYFFIYTWFSLFSVNQISFFMAVNDLNPSNFVNNCIRFQFCAHSATNEYSCSVLARQCTAKNWSSY